MEISQLDLFASLSLITVSSAWSLSDAAESNKHDVYLQLLSAWSETETFLPGLKYVTRRERVGHVPSVKVPIETLGSILLI